MENWLLVKKAEQNITYYNYNKSVIGWYLDKDWKEKKNILNNVLRWEESDFFSFKVFLYKWII